ncbi:hypothetical protein DM01DRAFT_1384609 [Hesseltinella vesiculosa]|uniref:Uncharacterized protein n=1 Tax=Hesseltinella vesiculosa TaxID=101127 RepID=A0A1X2GCU4_9FUNG|nr:hypothetical protein DM01DRAFT_1384609 [Hesseltinella vesiculosa]
MAKSNVNVEDNLCKSSSNAASCSLAIQVSPYPPQSMRACYSDNTTCILQQHQHLHQINNIVKASNVQQRFDPRASVASHHTKQQPAEAESLVEPDPIALIKQRPTANGMAPSSPLQGSLPVLFETKQTEVSASRPLSPLAVHAMPTQPYDVDDNVSLASTQPYDVNSPVDDLDDISGAPVPGCGFKAHAPTHGLPNHCDANAYLRDTVSPTNLTMSNERDPHQPALYTSYCDQHYFLSQTDDEDSQTPDRHRPGFSSFISAAYRTKTLDDERDDLDLALIGANSPIHNPTGQDQGIRDSHDTEAQHQHHLKIQQKLDLFFAQAAKNTNQPSTLPAKSKDTSPWKSSSAPLPEHGWIHLSQEPRQQRIDSSKELASVKSTSSNLGRQRMPRLGLSKKQILPRSASSAFTRKSQSHDLSRTCRIVKSVSVASSTSSTPRKSLGMTRYYVKSDPHLS